MFAELNLKINVQENQPHTLHEIQILNVNQPQEMY